MTTEEIEEWLLNKYKSGDRHMSYLERIDYLVTEIKELKSQLAMAEDAANKGDETRHNAQAVQDMTIDRCINAFAQTFGNRWKQRLTRAIEEEFNL